MNTSNYDPKTKDNIFNNDTSFSQKRFGELVNRVSALESNSSGCLCGNEEYTKVYDYTITDNDMFNNDLGTAVFEINNQNLKGSYTDIVLKIDNNTKGLDDISAFFIPVTSSSEILPIDCCNSYGRWYASEEEGNPITTIISQIQINTNSIQQLHYGCHLTLLEEEQTVIKGLDDFYTIPLDPFYTYDIAHIICKFMYYGYGVTSFWHTGTTVSVYARKKVKNVTISENSMLEYLEYDDLIHLGGEL